MPGVVHVNNPSTQKLRLRCEPEACSTQLLRPHFLFNNLLGVKRWAESISGGVGRHFYMAISQVPYPLLGLTVTSLSFKVAGASPDPPSSSQSLCWWNLLSNVSMHLASSSVIYRVLSYAHPSMQPRPALRVSLLSESQMAQEWTKRETSATQVK